MWAHLSGHMCVTFHLSGKSDRHTCGNAFVEMEAGFIGGGEFVSRSHFFDTLKNGSLFGYFSLAAAKLSDSSLATRLQSGNHMGTAASVSFNVKL